MGGAMVRSVASGWVVAWAVWGKELREALRDAHVLGFSIAFPILFFPLLVWGVSQLLLLEGGRMEADPPVVMVAGTGPGLELAGVLRADGVVVVPGAVDDPATVLAAGRVDAVVVVDDDTAVQVHHRSTEARARPTLRALRRATRTLRDSARDRWAESVGVDPRALAPPDVVRTDLAPTGRTAWSLLGRVLPGVALAALWLGAIYPTVEVVVGERERGTLETTRVTAPSGWGVVLGKLLAVLSIVSASALGNLGAMALTIAHLFATLGRPLGMAPPTAWSLGLGGLAVALSAVVAAAVLVAVASRARTLQQGQNLVALAATVGMAPGMIAALPSMELTTQTAWIPVVNMALLLRAAVSGDPVSAGAVGVAVVWTLALSAVLVRGASRVLVGATGTSRWGSR